jgi:hemerythrin-like domain-containing protein
MSEIHDERRTILGLGAAAGLAVLPGMAGARTSPGPGQEKETPAVEDLMREHGVLRRALLVYREVAGRLRSGGRGFDSRPLYRAATLFRSFGEDYHEKKLEEAHIFPVVRRSGGQAAAYPDILTAQHDRGREVTDYVLALTRAGAVPGGQREALGRALDQFVRMYENHAAREDTIVFPAWKQALSQKQIDEWGGRFEDIERRQFGKDGYEDAVRQIAGIETAYGLSDIGQFTAPPPRR